MENEFGARAAADWRFMRCASGEDKPKEAVAVEAERSGEGSAPNGSGSRNLGHDGGSKGANGSSAAAAGAGDWATKAGAQCQGSNQPQARSLRARAWCCAARSAARPWQADFHFCRQPCKVSQTAWVG